MFEGVQGRGGLSQTSVRSWAYTLWSVRSPGDPAELWELVDNARQRHLDGHPLLSRKFIVAVLIVTSQ